VTREERDLLEATARFLLKLQEQVAGMQIVLRELFLFSGNREIALARLRIRADLLKMEGKPSAYLESFFGGEEADSDVDLQSKGLRPTTGASE
jgi:hypothetical protein